MDAEVVIVGGGFAGSAAALELASLGREVCILERGQPRRDKVCGEGLMPHGVSQLHALGLLDAVEATGARPFRGIAYRVGASVAEGRFPGGYGLGVRRQRVDEVLAEAVSAHPRISVRYGVRARGLSGRAGAMVVATDGGLVRGRAIVAADGLHSRLRRDLGLTVRSTPRRRYGARLHVRHSQPDPELVHVAVTGDAEVYLTPTAPGELNVAVLLEHDQARTLRGDLEARILQLASAVPELEPFLVGAEVEGAAGAVGPLRQEASSWVADGVVLVGDAAFFLDGITGEGMSLALSGARLAARVVDRAMVGGEASVSRLASYPRRWSREVRDKLWLTEVVLWGIRHPRLASWAVDQLGRRPRLFGAVLDVNGGTARWPSLVQAVMP